MNDSDESESHRESEFISTRHHFTLDITCNIKVVAEQESQSTECLGRKDRILAELIQLTCSCQVEQLAAVECRRQSSRHHNRHEEFVASDAISWRQGKFSWLEMAFLDCSASKQQTTL